MTRMALGALLMTISGCANVPPPEDVDPPVQGETGRKCDASKAQGLVGRTRSREVGAEAMRLSGAAALRWIPEGAMVTMDYREDRVNLHLDGKGKVARVACG